MNLLENAAFNQLKQYDDADDLEGAGGGHTTTADKQQAEQNNSRKGRPFRIITDIVAGGGNKGDNLTESVLDCLPETGVGACDPQGEGDQQGSCRDNHAKDSNLNILEEALRTAAKRKIVQCIIEGRENREQHDHRANIG